MNDRELTLSLMLSLSQLIEVCIKKHFKAARFTGPRVDDRARHLEVTATCLGKDFVIRITPKVPES